MVVQLFTAIDCSNPQNNSLQFNLQLSIEQLSFYSEELILWLNSYVNLIRVLAEKITLMVQYSLEPLRVY